MSLQLKPSAGGDFAPHPEGVYSAVCVDVMDLGELETTWQGKTRMVAKVKVVFETGQVQPNGEPFFVAQSFTASLHVKAKLNHFLGKWRGRALGEEEEIDLNKLIGANCTLVLSHNTAESGKVYASIDAVSKPTVKVTPSGRYDAFGARARFAEWKARQGQAQPMATRTASQPTQGRPSPAQVQPTQARPAPAQVQSPQARPVHVPIGVVPEVDFNMALAATRANPTVVSADPVTEAMLAMDDDIPF